MNPDNVIFIVDVVERFAQIVVLIVMPIALITFIRSLVTPASQSGTSETRLIHETSGVHEAPTANEFPSVAVKRPEPTPAPDMAVLEATL